MVNIDAQLLEGADHFLYVYHPVLININVFEDNFELFFVLKTVVNEFTEIDVSVGVIVGPLYQTLNTRIQTNKSIEKMIKTQKTRAKHNSRDLISKYSNPSEKGSLKVIPKNTAFKSKSIDQ